jgi:3-hydroxyacyl-[acyl-carrier-protein] dehydratase
MPGVMTIEAMAQAGGALLLTEVPDREDKLMLFTGIDSARFRRPIVPGDQLRIEVTVVNWRSRVVKMQGVCTVDGKVAADATITCQVVPRVRNTVPKTAAEPATEQAAE